MESRPLEEQLKIMNESPKLYDSFSARDFRHFVLSKPVLEKRTTDEIINADNNEFIYNIRPGNEFGVYSNENNKDDKNNNVYNKIASEIVNIFNKLNNNILKYISNNVILLHFY